MKVEARREHFVRIAEHEILLAFNDDEGAENFETWWEERGKTIFIEWLEQNS